MTPQTPSRPLLSPEGENRAIRVFINHLDNRTYQNLRLGLQMSGFDFCVPDWAQNEVGFVTAEDTQRWLRFIFSQETLVQEAPSA